MTLPVTWKPIKEVKFIIIHCSATRPSQTKVDVSTIREWHLKRGFLDVGYHYVIKRDGTVQKGRPDICPGAHAEGVNHISLGICLVGGVSEADVNIPEDNFTASQMRSLRILVEMLLEDHPNAGVIGHRDVPGVAKACPSFDVLAWFGREFDPTGNPSN